MPNILDVFSGDGFSVMEMTDAVNLVPNQYGRINDLGLFRPNSITTLQFAIERMNGVLNLISSKERGTPGHKNKRGKRDLRYFGVPHFPLEDRILPSDLQGVREFGTPDMLLTAEKLTNDLLIQMSRKHDITHEYLKAGAIAGIVLDPDGSTLLNLFTELNITEKSVDFLFNTTGDQDKISEKIREVLGHIEDNLEGDTMTHVHALCSPGFFNGLLLNPEFKEAYTYYTNLAAAAGAADPLRRDVRKGFWHLDVYWEEYRGQATILNEAGTTTIRKFIPDNTARFFPIGTTDTFSEVYAPADWMETVNTPGLRKYAKVAPDVQRGEFVDIITQSNVIPYCKRPKVLVKGVYTPA